MGRLNRVALFVTIVVISLMSHMPLKAERLEDGVSIVDSLNISRQQELESHRNNRGLVQMDYVFVPKGHWIVGATASYSAHVNDNYSLLLIDGINSNGYTVKASPIAAYTFNDNMSAGVRFEYGRSLLSIDSAMLSIGGDGQSLELQVNNYYLLQHSYTGMAIFRQYIPFGQVRRFALFAESRLEVGSGQAKFAHDSPIKGTYSKSYSAGLGVVPGIVAFATNNTAIEVTVGMLGIGFSHTDQVFNQVEVGSSNSSSMSFVINILSIGLGVASYF